MGFGIVLPLLPRYAADFRASGAEIGLLFASFSGMQFLFAPVWGRLSDRHGRRRLILLGLFGSTASYVLFAMARTYALLLISRVLAGIFAATISTAQAYIADVTGPGDRGREMALIGAAFGIGFTFGPVLGWVTHDFLGPSWPGIAAAALSAAAFVFALRRLPEPERHAPMRAAGASFAGFRHVFGRPRLLLIVMLQIVTTIAFAGFEGTLALLTKERYGQGIRGNGLLFTYIGVCLLIAQGVLVRRYMPRVGERSFVRIGTLLLAAGLLGIPLGGTALAWVLPVLAVTVLGFAMVTPSLASLLSLHTPSDLQGEVMGLGQSGTSFARILGPFVGNILFAIDPESPYWAGAAMVFVATAAALALPERPVVSDR